MVLQLSFFSCNEFNTYFVTKNIPEVWLSDEFIVGFLKMWPNLLDQKYTYSKLNDHIGDDIKLYEWIFLVAWSLNFFCMIMIDNSWWLFLRHDRKWDERGGWHAANGHRSEQHLEAGLKFSADHMDKEQTFWRKTVVTWNKNWYMWCTCSLQCVCKLLTVTMFNIVLVHFQGYLLSHLFNSFLTWPVSVLHTYQWHLYEPK